MPQLNSVNYLARGINVGFLIKSKMRGNILLLGICLFLVSCVHEEKHGVETISVDIDKVENLSLFQTYDYIALEATDDALLENVVKAKIVGNDIFLLSSYGGDIYHFIKEGKKGKFVHKWSRGNAPGELVLPTDFIVNKEDKTITILDFYRMLKTYTFDGKLVNERKIDNPYFSFCICNGDTLLFDPNLSPKNSCHLSVLNQDGELSLLSKKENSKRVGFMPTNVFVKKNNEEILLSHMLSDTIYDYSIKKRSITPVFYVDVNRPSINSVSDINFESARDFDEKAMKGNYISGISGMSCWGDELFFIIYYQDKFHYISYNMSQKEVKLYTRLSMELPNAKYYVNRDDESLTCMYTMEELKKAPIKDEGLKKIVENAADDDNPILVIFKH